MDKEEVIEEVLVRVKDTYTLEGEEQDRYIKTLTSNAFEEYKIITGADEVKTKFLFIIESVVNKRFVRRGSEGLDSENVDGYRLNYRNSEDDFKEFYVLMRTEYNLKVGEGRRGFVRVIR